MRIWMSNPMYHSPSKVLIKFEVNIQMLISTWLLLTKPWMIVDIFDPVLVTQAIACGIQLFDRTILASSLLS